MNVGQIFTQNALKLPAQEVLLFKDKAYNYEEANRISNKLAAFFTERGIKNRDVVAVILSNCPEFAFIYFACMKTGAIFAPIDTKLSEQNIQGIAEEIQPALIFAEGPFPENHFLHSKSNNHFWPFLLSISSATSTIISSCPPTILRLPSSIKIVRVSNPYFCAAFSA
jgi:acyl-CoA synthetase (AMP-forming)/AMP-acid ligase II